MGIQVNKELCAGCGVCVEVCATGAIHIEDNIAEIDHALCTQCEACRDVCPNGAITIIPESARRSAIVALHSDETRIVPHSNITLLPEKAPSGHGFAEAALSILGREVIPRLVNVLATALERRLTTPTKSASTSLSTSQEITTVTRRGIRRQVRYRGGRTGNRNQQGRR